MFTIYIKETLITHSKYSKYALSILLTDGTKSITEVSMCTPLIYRDACIYSSVYISHK